MIVGRPTEGHEEADEGQVDHDGPASHRGNPTGEAG